MNTTMQSSSSNLSEKVREDLKQLLACTYVLYVKTQNFHWNVKGPRFQQLHAFFEEQYTGLSSAIDEIAEQIRILQARPPSSMKEFLDLSNIQESVGELSENEMLSSLLADHESIIHHLSQWISDAQEVKDESTADLLIERSREHEKIAWMIRSHLG
jgi:starvation-inducible DNA-binding protein